MHELVRAGALRNFATLVNKLGGHTDALLRCVGLDQQKLEDANNHVDLRAMITLLENTATAIGVPSFGLQLAIQQDFEIFGPLALAAQNCETLGDAIRCTSRFFYTHNPYKEVLLKQLDSSLARVEVRITLTDPPAHQQISERNAMLTYQTLMMLSSGDYQPHRILLPHPPLSSQADYSRYFDRTPVLFEQKCVAVDFNLENLALPMQERNDQLRQVATAFLENQWQQLPHPPTFEGRVREIIRTLLPSGRCNQRQLAATLCLHPRTVQRRLAAGGASFEEIKSDIRRTLAQHYLQNTHLPLSQVAALLDYSEQSALTRSCHRWFGQTPLTLRRRASTDQ